MSPNAAETTLFEGIPEMFRGRVQDRDNRPEDLEASWWIGDQEICPPAAPTSNNETFCEITLDDGDTEVRLLVTDKGGLGSEDVQVFWAQPSAEPTASITSLDATGQYFADQPIIFEGQVDDVEDSPDQLVSWWESNIAGRLGAVEASPSESGRVSGSGFLPEGDHQIRLYVQDRAGNISFDTEVIRVGPANRPPECHGITSPAADAVERSGRTVTFTASVTDPDVPANLLDVEWESNWDGVIGESQPGSGGAVEFYYGDLTVNSHVITMTATDSFGQTCTASTLLIIDSPPIINLTSPQPNRVYEFGEPILFEAQVTDNEDPEQTLTVQWEDNIGGVLSRAQPSTAGLLSFPRSDMAVGQHLVTLTVTDGSGLDTQVQVPYSVNALPGAPGIEIQPAPARTEDPLTAVVTFDAVDPDNDPITYTYTWYRDGVVQLGISGPTIPASSTARGDVWRVEVFASDAYGAGPVTSTTVTIQNTAPVLDDVTITGGPYFETSTMTCVPGAASDADSDSITYSYSWTRGDDTTLTATTNTLTGQQFDRGDRIRCTVTPTDGSAAGAAVTSAEVTVLNTPPEVASASISPAAPEADATLTCVFSYSDDDLDTSASTITWRVNSTEVGSGATYAGDLNAGDVVSCSVQANDGITTGNTVSASTTIAPSAPSIDDVEVTPNAPSASAPLTCNYTGYVDPQGDPDQSRYQWTVAGAPAGTGRTLTSGFAKGDVVTCTVTPSDGDYDGVPLQDSVTIQNSPPTAPTLDIDPAFPLEGLDDVVCSVRNQSSDADGDTITYRFTWTQGTEGNRRDYFGATDEAQQSTFPASDYSGLEELVCTVTPFDGADTGPSATIRVGTLPSIEPKLATGGSHSCVLNRRGEVTCWGLQQDGRTVAPPDIFLDLDGGLNYTCGIVEDSTLDCWGLLETPLNNRPLDPPVGTFTNVSASDNVACATPSSGGVQCWGDNTYNQITGAPTSGQFSDIAVGTRHACALRASGSVVCWGDDTFDQGQVPSGTYSRIAAGSLHSCGVKVDGSLACWGNNGDGKATPPTGSDYVEVGAGVRHSCAIAADGTISCWGSNLDGRATPPSTDSGGNPLNFVGIDLWIHSCAVDDLGQAYCWGRDDEGQSSPP